MAVFRQSIALDCQNVNLIGHIFQIVFFDRPKNNVMDEFLITVDVGVYHFLMETPFCILNWRLITTKL